MDFSKNDKNDQVEIINRRELPIINLNTSFDIKLLEKLLSSCRYVYVESDDKSLIGIIGRDDLRYKYGQEDHINRNFIFLNEDINTISEAHKLIGEKKSREVPVLNSSNQLLYAIGKRKNIINRFDFDWSLCDVDYVKDFFSKYENVYYFTYTNKIKGLVNKVFDFQEIKRIEDEVECRNKDLIICDSLFDNKGFTRHSINQIYLTILSRSIVRSLLLKRVKYYYFQSPIDYKIRKENKIYLNKKIDNWTEEDLKPIYLDDEKDMEHWLLQDYKNIKFGEIDGRYLPLDAKSKTYNVRNNQRVTFYQPQYYKNTIWVIGTCIVRGFGVSDEMTIPSILQNKLNCSGYNQYIVRNLGTGGGLIDYSDIRDFVNIARTSVSKGDIVIHIGYNCWEMEGTKMDFEEYYELSWLFNRKHLQRCFFNDAPHLTPYANRVVVDYIFKNIEKDLSIL